MVAAVQPGRQLPGGAPPTPLLPQRQGWERCLVAVRERRRRGVEQEQEGRGG